MIIGLFALELQVPVDVEVWLPNVAVVLLSLWFPRRWQTYLTTAVCSVLTVLGLLISPYIQATWVTIVNRFLGIMVFWLTGWMGLAARRSAELEDINQRLRQEIAERQRGEEKLAEQASLLDLAQDAILVRDMDHRILFWNHGAQRLYGWTAQEAIGRNAIELFGILAGGVAHDFNNLLTPILMAVKLLREPRPENERQNLLSTLQASAERGAEMVRKLLSFAGGGETAMTPVQLRYIVKEITSIIGPSFPKTITIATWLDEQLHPLLADSTQLSQVLMNLCVNARDAMPEGGKLTITAENVELDAGSPKLINGALPGPYVLLTVSDTWVGIPKEIINRIFDPFFSTKEYGKRSGLGLSSVLGIVKSHGGFIDVESETGKGSRFAVYLPATPEASPRPVEGTSPARPRGHGEMILVVDDEAAILTTAKATLEENDYRVVTAPDGAAALKEFAAHKDEIQLVVLDLMMPGMDGFSTMTALRRLSPSIRVVAASGLRPVGQLAIAIGAGELNFLQKPYSDEQLLTTLHHALGNSGL